MNDGQRNSTMEERARALLAGQTSAFCRHGREHGKCLECSAPEMLAMLRELEWANIEHSCSGTGWCPTCGAGEHGGHHPNCRLAALLKRLGE